MDKVAIFVEGQTELIFVDRLVHELAHGSGLAVEHAEATGGAIGARKVKIFKRITVQEHHRWYFLIVNCAGDGNVKSDVRDRYQGLIQAGYNAIFGLRDVYGMFTLAQVPKLRKFLNLDLPTEPIRIEFILAIMEIETWFLAEYTHLQRLHPSLTPSYIRKMQGFDPAQDDLELRVHPADDLNRVYRLAGYSYDKHRRNTERTIELLDFTFIRRTLARRIPDLGRLIAALERIFGRAKTSH
jgi:hypothetical protein